MNEETLNENEVVEILDSELTTAEVDNTEIVMSEDEAKELTISIQSTATALYVLLKKAHDEKAHIALGYKTWAEYIDEEFDFSRARSYQLINQANVIEEINKSSGVELFITEREARDIKNKLPAITKKLEKVKEEDLPAEKAEERAKEVIQEARQDHNEVDNAKRYSGDNDDGGYADNEDTSPQSEEWTPAPIDRILKDDDLFYYNNLMTTLKVFESMPDASELGQTLSHSTKDTSDLMEKAEAAFTWITKLMDEIE